MHTSAQTYIWNVITKLLTVRIVIVGPIRYIRRQCRLNLFHHLSAQRIAVYIENVFINLQICRQFHSLRVPFLLYVRLSHFTFLIQLLEEIIMNLQEF